MPVTKKNLPAKQQDLPHGDLAGEMLASSPLPTAVISANDLQLIWANQAWHALFQQKPITTASVFGDALAKVLQTRSGVTLHDHVIEGQRCQQIRFFSCGNDKAGVIVLPAPETHRFDAADQVRNALRPAGMMARMLAHEIRNPLAGIQAAGQLLSKKLENADRALADLVVAECQRIGRLINKMAVFDDEAQMPLAKINLHTPVEQAAGVISTAFPALQIMRRFDPSLPDIDGNHDQLVQVFINLLTNAAEAGADKLVLHTGYQLGTSVIHPRSLEKLPLRIAVEDNGSGMSEETSKRLFEAYYTTKSTGQGFGLAIAAKIIDDHGGVIEVAESTAGKTVIAIYLPAPLDGEST